jgi:hypothetical protein
MTTQPPSRPPDDELDDEPMGEKGGERDAADTRIGSVVGELARATRNLPVIAERRTPSVASAAQHERISVLINALGDPQHPLHQRAAADLVAIGEPAVPALSELLRSDSNWLQAFRAAEALGQIGDGRAAGPLLNALRHSNSNVRWSAVRALAVVGDARTLIELRRVARNDRGKTSWGEPIAGAAQSALDQMQGRNILLRGADLLQTAVACVIMLVALIFAWSVVTSVREELSGIGRIDPSSPEAQPLVRTALPTIPPEVPTLIPTLAPTATIAEEAPAAADTPLLLGAVVSAGNVRSSPDRLPDNVIGQISEGDEIIFLTTTPDFQWYRIRLGESRSAASQIRTEDGSGWVSRSLLTEPPADVPVDEALPTPTAAP